MPAARPVLPPPDPRAEVDELREYLGDAFDPALLADHEQAVVREWEAAGSEDELYRTSQAYLYDLTAFATHATKRPYHDVILRALPDGGRLIDVGCGIGADGLRLLDAGYDVAFADFDNPSTAYLRWRLARRGRTEVRVYDLDAGPLPAGHDLAYCFDVIEHVADPWALLDRLEATADQVLVNFLDPEPGETPLHHDLPVAALLGHVARRHLHEYRLLNFRSHLVRYGPAPAGPAAQPVGRARRRRALSAVA